MYCTPSTGLAAIACDNSIDPDGKAEGPIR